MGTPTKRKDKVPQLLGKMSTGSNNGTRATVRFFDDAGLLMMALEDMESGASMRFTERRELEDFLILLDHIAEKAFNK